MELENQCLFTKEHEWVSIDGNIATIGISDFAQEQLGDITFIELPGVGDDLDQFEQYASVESVKAASDIYAPLDGKVVDTNGDLADEPEVINTDPYQSGWIYSMEPDDATGLEDFMDADTYQDFVVSEE